MNRRGLLWLVPLLVMGLLLAGCQGTPIDPAPTSAVAVTNTPAPTEDSPATAPATDNPATDAEAPDTASPDAALEAGDDATEPAAPNPLAADPARPGFTIDGSPTLGSPDAPVVIVDFSDFQ